MRASRYVSCLLASGLVFACNAEPSHETGQLDLRAALLSTPEAIAALPLEQRMSLATQMEEAAREQRAASQVAANSESLSVDLLEAFDEPRSVDGDDAIVVLAVDHGVDVASLHTLQHAAGDGGAPMEHPAVELVMVDPELLEEPAASALAGRASEALEHMARETGAREVVIGRSMPTGLLGDGERLYVNPVWLLLLASLDEHDAVGSSSSALIAPVGHHDTESSGWGCYGSLCGTTGTCGTPTCGRCGCDWGLCASECGDDSEGCHCTTAQPQPAPASPLDGLWLIAPVVYLLLRRRG